MGIGPTWSLYTTNLLLSESFWSTSSSPFTMFIFICCMRCRASRQPITSVELKLFARQVVASRAAKLKFVAESRTRVYFAQVVASACNTVAVSHKGGNTRNNGLQLAMQQYCETVLPDLKVTVKLNCFKLSFIGDPSYDLARLPDCFRFSFFFCLKHNPPTPMLQCLRYHAVKSCMQSQTNC